MTNPPVEFEKADFEAVIAPFEDAEEWVRRNTDEKPVDAITAAAEQDGSVGELVYTHRTTDATLSLQFPDYGRPPGVLKALLDQPLDPCITYRCDLGAETFLPRLCRAHHTIATLHATAYVIPVADSALILWIHIPPDYSERAFHETVEALDSITTSVESLHDAIMTPLDGLA